MNNPLKSINVVGVTPNLSYKLCPEYFNLNVGVWEIALSDIAFTFKKDVLFSQTVYEVSSNLVQGYYYPDKKTLAKNNIVLGRFDLSPNNLKLLQYFGSPKWFVVNNQASEIKLFFKEWPERKPLLQNPSIRVSVNLLLRRVM